MKIKTWDISAIRSLRSNYTIISGIFVVNCPLLGNYSPINKENLRNVAIIAHETRQNPLSVR
jgi:hypothetical protein